jgi:TPR repeat protein
MERAGEKTRTLDFVGFGASMKKTLLAVFLLLSGCAGTDTDSSVDSMDPYVKGVQYFDDGKFEAARREWEPLVRAGDCDAQYRYGTLYFFGVGVPKDFRTAEKWWFSAAKRGHAVSQMLLGIMHGGGYVEMRDPGMRIFFNCRKSRCVSEKNPVAAYQWMRLAERNADDDGFRKAARKKAEALQKALTAEQAANADDYARGWRPSPERCKRMHSP